MDAGGFPDYEDRRYLKVTEQDAYGKREIVFTQQFIKLGFSDKSTVIIPQELKKASTTFQSILMLFEVDRADSSGVDTYLVKLSAEGPDYEDRRYRRNLTRLSPIAKFVYSYPGNNPKAMSSISA